MKHSNFYQKYQAIEAQEYRELKAALKAHGGEYIFFDCDAENAKELWHEKNDWEDIPVIYGSYDCGWSSRSEYYYVTRVKQHEHVVEIYGFRVACDSPMNEECIEIIEYGYIEKILDAIPETDEVHDVTELTPLNYVPVLSLSRDDVEAAGFASDLTDDQLMSLAHAVSKRLGNYMEDFWASLEDACETIGYERIDKEENE